jgi:hypothetical protein
MIRQMTTADNDRRDCCAVLWRTPSVGDTSLMQLDEALRRLRPLTDRLPRPRGPDADGACPIDDLHVWGATARVLGQVGAILGLNAGTRAR